MKILVGIFLLFIACLFAFIALKFVVASFISLLFLTGFVGIPLIVIYFMFFTYSKKTLEDLKEDAQIGNIVKEFLALKEEIEGSPVPGRDLEKLEDVENNFVKAAESFEDAKVENDISLQNIEIQKLQHLLENTRTLKGLSLPGGMGEVVPGSTETQKPEFEQKDPEELLREFENLNK
ncbi:hypothetical protein ACFL35_02390 [Candidatus Riflebacteria bacterium]